MSELTAAEKNEQRRQKILSKRRARMAYAGGDRTSLPSTAPPEPDDPQTLTQEPSPSDVATTRSDISAPLSMPPSLSSSTWTTTVPPPSLSANGPLSTQHLPKAITNTAILFASPLVRLVVVMLAALFFTLLVHFRPAALHISALEAFALLQAVLSLPAVPTWLQQRRLHGHPGGSDFAFPGGGGVNSLFSVVEALSRAAQWYAPIMQTLRELCVFLMVFLLVLYILTRW